MSTNFSHLRACDEQLFGLGVLAERYFPEDPNTALLKLRQWGAARLSPLSIFDSVKAR